MSPAVLFPALALLSEERARSLEVRRRVTGMAPVPSTHSDRPDFVPADLYLWRSRIENAHGGREEYCSILWPQDRDLGSFARWDSTYSNRQSAMPDWLRVASLELYRSLADGAAAPEGAVSAGVSLTREYVVTGASLHSYANGDRFAAGYLSVSWTRDPSDKARDRYRLEVRPVPGSTGSAMWAGYRGDVYARDVPAWVRDASEAALEEMEAI